MIDSHCLWKIPIALPIGIYSGVDASHLRHCKIVLTGLCQIGQRRQVGIGFTSCFKCAPLVALCSQQEAASCAKIRNDVAHGQDFLLGTRLFQLLHSTSHVIGKPMKFVRTTTSILCLVRIPSSVTSVSASRPRLLR